MHPPPIARILETALYVDDLDRAERFYTSMFDFVRNMRDERMCSLAIPGRHVLLLFQRGGSTQASLTSIGPIPPHDAHGAQHLCFAISRGALDDWRAWIMQQGLAIESELAWPGRGTSLYFRDPDGHSIEVATPGLWPNDPIDDPADANPPA